MSGKLLEEASGLAASRTNRGIVWSHNDRNHHHELFAIDSATGDIHSRWELEGAENEDYEDMAIGPGPAMGVEYLYLGDIGDNYEERKRLTVYRIREPDVRAGGYTSRSSGGVDRRVIPEADYDTLTLRVPDRPSNSEVMMIDPWTQAVYVITKEDGDIWRTTEKWGEGDATLKLEKVGQVNHFDNELTGGDISRDGSEVLLRSYTSVYHFCRGTGEALEDVLSWEFGEILPYEAEEQGESVAFAPNKNDGYYTLSESSGERWVPLYHYRRREIS